MLRLTITALFSVRDYRAKGCPPPGAPGRVRAPRCCGVKTDLFSSSLLLLGVRGAHKSHPLILLIHSKKKAPPLQCLLQSKLSTTFNVFFCPLCYFSCFFLVFMPQITVFNFHNISIFLFFLCTALNPERQYFYFGEYFCHH